MKIRTLVAIAVVAFTPLGGCMTTGEKFTMAEVASLEPGVSTIEDAVRLLGEPAARSTYADGTQLLQWMYRQVVYVAGESRHVTILFDRRGRMLRVAHQSETKI